MGIFVGSLPKGTENVKIGGLIAVSMVCSWAAGLMNSALAKNMKNMIEEHCPLLNRINPVAVVTDALYCMNIYDDSARLTRDFLILGMMSVVLVTVAFLQVRRKSYDSI